MKRTILILALILTGAACSSSPASASDLHSAFVADYGYVAEEFGVSTTESFEDYVANLDDCSTLDGEGTAMVTLLVGSTLSEHGDDVASFVGDLNALLTAVNAEGFCTTQTQVPTGLSPTKYPTTTTTTNGLTASDCNTMANNLADEMNAYAEHLGSPTLHPVELLYAVGDGRSMISKGRAIIAACGHYSPGPAQAADEALDYFETQVDSLEASL